MGEPTSDDLQAAELLERAADVVEQGWCQYVPEDSDGNHCLTGAIYVCLDLPPRPSNEERAPHLHMFKRIAPAIRGRIDSDSEVRWNNAPNRTKGEVVCLLLDAAADLRKAGECE